MRIQISVPPSDKGAASTPVATGIASSEKEQEEAAQVEETWPCQSSTSLPPLTKSLCQRLNNGRRNISKEEGDTNSNVNNGSGGGSGTGSSGHRGLRFIINEECTAMKLTPSGRLLITTHADGTVRLFDLTGQRRNKHSSGPVPTSRNGKNVLLNSKHHQRYGAVVSQIHAKGVHTALLMDVDVSEDGLWCFAGVLRGSQELVAVHLGHVEAAYDRQTRGVAAASSNNGGGGNSAAISNLLDLVTVYKHSDAKLRGFGACKRLKQAESGNKRPKYLLFTGKGIKSIHIWSFEPPVRPDQDEPIWTELYHTQTSGNSIKLLRFRRCPAGNLLALSKSDGQKVRVWDLSYEEKKQYDDEKKKEAHRPNKPPFCDVANTESTTVGVAGGFCLCGGSELYNQMSIVSLDVGNLQSAYNHTELALPGATTAPSSLQAGTTRPSSRRQQRGDLKSIERVAGMTFDGGQALLELSDGNLVQYTQDEAGIPILRKIQPPQLPNVGNNDGTGNITGDIARCMCVGRIGDKGVAVAAIATYDPVNGKGRINLWSLDDDKISLDPKQNYKREGYWGFAGCPRLPTTTCFSSSLPPMSHDEITDTTTPSSMAQHPFVTPKFEEIKAVSDNPVGGMCQKRKEATEPPLARKLEDNMATFQVSPDHENPGRMVETPAFSKSEGNSAKYIKLADGTKKPAGKTPRKNDLMRTPATPRSDVASPIPATAVTNKNSKAERTLKTAKKTPSRKNKGTNEKTPSKSKGAKTKAATRSLATSTNSNKTGKFAAADVTETESPERNVANILAELKGTPFPSVPRKRGSEKQKTVGIDVTSASTHWKTPVKNSPTAVSTQTALPSPSCLVTPGTTQGRPSKLLTFKSPKKPLTRVSNRKNDPELRDRYRNDSREKQALVRKILAEIPSTNVTHRMGLKRKQPSTLDEAQDWARRKLAAEHRAAHELIRKKVLRVTLSVLQTVINAPSPETAQTATTLLEESLNFYQDMAEEIMHRQEMEASSLASQQTYERQGEPAPCLTVSFAFPTLFQQAMDCAPILY